MAVVMVSLGGQIVSPRRGKPRLLVRGQRRKAVKNLLAALKVLENQEWYENVRSANNDYEPFLVLVSPVSKYSKAVATLKERMEETLAAKA